MGRGFDLWPKNFAHQITGSQQDTTIVANALDLAAGATRDHVELALSMSKPHGGRNANATFAKRSEEDKLVGVQIGKGVVCLTLQLRVLMHYLVLLSLQYARQGWNKLRIMHLYVLVCCLFLRILP